MRLKKSGIRRPLFKFYNFFKVILMSFVKHQFVELFHQTANHSTDPMSLWESCERLNLKDLHLRDSDGFFSSPVVGPIDFQHPIQEIRLHHRNASAGCVWRSPRNERVENTSNNVLLHSLSVKQGAVLLFFGHWVIQSRLLLQISITISNTFLFVSNTSSSNGFSCDLTFRERRPQKVFQIWAWFFFVKLFSNHLTMLCECITQG